MTTDLVPAANRPRLWRSRWAAIGAAIAVSLGGGGFLIVDAAASTDSTIVMTDPVRILDTRDPVNVGLPGPFVSQVTQKLQVTGSIPTTTGTAIVVPAGATGVLLNVTSVGSTANGFVSIRPGDATGLPSTSSLNVTAGVVVPNAVQVAIPTSGANAGKIDITWDAYGVDGQTTDILIDVVGYSSDAKLKTIEATLLAKANSADVYTKAQIDARPFDSLVGGGLVYEAGTIDRQFGNVSVTRTGTGSYTVNAPGLVSPCGLTLQATTLNGFNTATSRFISAGYGTSCSVTVRTTNAAGALVDSNWQFTLFHGGSGVTPLSSSESEPCVENIAQSCAAD